MTLTIPVRYPLVLRVMRSAGPRPKPWFIVLSNGNVVSETFATREQAEAYRQQLLSDEKLCQEVDR